MRQDDEAVSTDGHRADPASDAENTEALEREALRRIASLSTELEDISEVEYRRIRLERVVLVGVWTGGSAAESELSMTELARLAETAGSVVCDALIQRRNRPDSATYVGKGKAGELAGIIAAHDADTLICDGELTPGQLQALERIVKVKVVDRTWLILDIFAQHARSREGKAQVQLAQLQYMLPRLRGWGEAMSRQAGGIGTRGPGETKLESDRRRIRDQISRLAREIKDMSAARETQRRNRRRHHVASVAIVGYTNAGKSSLLNRLTDADVMVADELFATLDPTVRRARTSAGQEYTLTDTVGFVRHLPHQLVDAFTSTLEEVRHADLLLHVVDGADPDPAGQIAAVREVLQEIGAQDLPEILVANKADLGPSGAPPEALGVSARTGAGIEELNERIATELQRSLTEVRIVVPFDRGDLVSDLHDHGQVRSVAYLENGVALDVLVPRWLYAQVVPFLARDGG